jgi:HlyD family secretion protein
MSKKKKMKVALALGVLALLAPVGWAGVNAFWGPSHGPGYRTARVERGDMATYVSATGTLNPVVTVQVSTQVSGTIAKLFVDFNSVVHEGQPVAQLDQATFHAKLTEAEALLENARAEVKNTTANVQTVRAAIENAQAEVASQRANLQRAQVAVVDAKRGLDRNQALSERHLISRSERDTAQTGYDSGVAQHNGAQAQLASAEAKVRSAQAQLRSAEAQVEKAKAQVSQALAAVEQAKVEVDRTVIRSPISGMVMSRNVDVGQTVAASLQAPTLFSIAHNLTHMQVDANVSEADIGTVAPGQAVTFTVDAYPSQIFRGTVREIRSAPLVVQNVVNYDTVIAVDNSALQLKPGMTATVSILVVQRDKVLKVPKAALRFQPQLTEREHEQLGTVGRERPRGGAPVGTRQPPEAQRQPWQGLPKVWALTADGSPRPISVRLGISDNQFTEVTDGGLQEGQEVIVGVSGKDSSGSGGSRPSVSSRGGPQLRF